MNKQIKNLVLLFLTIIFTLSPVSNLKAAEFDPSFIVSNKDIEDSNSLNLFEIQRFLSNRGSYLANYTAQSESGVMKSAAEIIYEASQNFGINPKWILVTLQKEQSLIGSATPNDDQLAWSMGYAVCDDCSKDDPKIQKFKGFGRQVFYATGRIRYYINNPQQFNFKAGNSYKIDDFFVTIKNAATAYLYNYTPHIHGNKNFWRLWKEYFTQVFPDGSLVQADGEVGVWYIENGTRRPILSKAVLLSRFNPKDIIKVSKTDLESITYGLRLMYPNYSLVESYFGQKYMLVDDEKKKFESDEVFGKLGFNEEEVEIIDDLDLSSYKEGRVITMTSAYPQGQLIQDKTTGGVYYVKDGFKHPIVSKEIMKSNYPSVTVIKGDQTTLDSFLTAEKVKFKDGKLIKSKDLPDVYVISNGYRRLISNEDTFKRMGYEVADIITTNQEAVNVHPLGDPIDVTFGITTN